MRVEAVRLGAEALKWHTETFWNGGEWSFEVTDDTGLTLYTLYTLYFLAIEAAPLRPRARTPSG